MGRCEANFHERPESERCLIHPAAEGRYFRLITVL